MNIQNKPEAALSNVLVAASLRSEQWRQLNSLARSWAAAPSNKSKLPREQCAELLTAINRIEHCWAYPGERLLSSLRSMLDGGDAPGFARLARQLSASILSGDYRHDDRVWDPKDEGGHASIENLPSDAAGKVEKPYFEVLVVTPSTPAQWPRSKEQMRKMRRGDDRFVYEAVHVGSYEDAMLAVIVNSDIQSVVLADGFGFESSLDLPDLKEVINRAGDASADTGAAGSLAMALARRVRNYRPELDLFLLSDRSPEQIAGADEAAPFKRVFHQIEEPMELHLSILDGIQDRFATPYFDNLQKYALRPIGTFHALPIARGKSVFNSNWIRDMGSFYGTNIFFAESCATTGGLDSLLEPTGNIKLAQQAAARAFGAKKVYFGTNGTSTSNKIVVQAVCKPGDIVIVDRNCHKSHHYGFVLAGAQPFYVEAFPLTEYSMYGSVPLRTIKQALLDCAAGGKLDRVKVVDMTNCTFDGHMYNPRKLMEECLAIKPDLIFLWDEAWFGFARFNPLHRRRTAMGAAAALTERYRSKAYREEYDAWKKKAKPLDPKDPKAADQHRLPDPDKVRIRVYQTNSTHKSMSSFRQGSMMLIWDDDFHKVEGPFQESFLSHTSTSPNLQLIAGLDLARRQMEFEGYAMTMRAIDIAIRIRNVVNSHPLISKYFHIATPEDMIPKEYRESGIKDYGPPNSSWAQMAASWDQDEFALDPTRITVVCGNAGFNGNQFKSLLSDRFDIQINKTSRNSVLVQTNINNTHSDAALLIKALADLSRDIDARLVEEGASAKAALAANVKSLMKDVPDLPNFSRFHDSFRDHPKGKANEGHMRPAFFMAYDEENCEFIKLASPDLDKRLKDGPELVSANFVIPYPPGFPIMVPGQVITHETITYMRKLDVKEIHGYVAAQGIKLIKPDALKKSKASSTH
jgi:arginine decarboxylase